MAEPIATATVEIVADSAKLTADVAAMGEKLTAVFKEAASQADTELNKIGGTDVWGDLKSEANTAGNSIEKDMKEAATQSNAQLDKISTHSGGVFTKAKLAMAGFSYLGVQAFRSIVSEASNLNESQNAVNVTFGDAAEGISKLGRNAATAVGLSESAFDGLAVQFSSFATTVAGPGGDVVTTMADLTGRAADFASVMNLDVQDAAQLFQSGLAGETEPLRKYGLDLSAAAVEAYALAEGIAKPGEEMTEQQKVQARYGLLMKQTSKTQGDFANTSDGLANSQRILQAKMANLSAEVGTALLPILAKIATFVADVVIPAIQWMANNFEYVVAAVAGVTVAMIAYNASAIAAGAATLVAMAPWIAAGAAVAALAAGVVWAYQNVDWFREAVDKAWVILQDVASFLADVFVVAWNGIAAAVEWTTGTVQALWDKAEPVRGFLAGAFSLAIDVITGYINVWQVAIQFVIDTVQWLWDKSEPVRAFLAGAFAIAIDAVTVYFNIWKTAIDTVVSVIQFLWAWVLEPVVTWLGGVFATAMADAQIAWGLIETGVNDVITVVQTLWETWLEPLVSWLGDTLGSALNGAAVAFGYVETAVGFVIDKLKIAVDWVKTLIDWVKKIPTPSSILGSIKDFGPGIPFVDLPGAEGGLFSVPTRRLIGEAGAEALIPLTRPQRAMDLMNQSGLGEMWDRANGGRGGSIISIQNATFQDATDADLVAQRALAALMAKSVAA
jgi:hypothetical protein